MLKGKFTYRFFYYILKVFLKYSDVFNQKISYLIINLKEDIDYQESSCNLVTEYVVINLKKLDSKYLERDFFEKASGRQKEIDFRIFMFF